MIGKMFSRSSSEGGPEAQEQISLFVMIDLMTNRFPELKCCHHVPNGGQRSVATAGRLKSEGVRPGVPDIHLPVPHGGYCGLWIELKVGRNKTTPAQECMIEALRAYGNRVEVCYGWASAWEVLLEYMRS